MSQDFINGFPLFDPLSDSDFFSNVNLDNYLLGEPLPFPEPAQQQQHQAAVNPMLNHNSTFHQNQTTNPTQNQQVDNYATEPARKSRRAPRPKAAAASKAPVARKKPAPAKTNNKRKRNDDATGPVNAGLPLAAPAGFPAAPAFPMFPSIAGHAVGALMPAMPTIASAISVPVPVPLAGTMASFALPGVAAAHATTAAVATAVTDVYATDPALQYNFMNHHEEKKRKLQRKAFLARESRAKKKQKLNEMSTEVDRLNAELAALKSRYQALAQASAQRGVSPPPSSPASPHAYSPLPESPGSSSSSGSHSPVYAPQASPKSGSDYENCDMPFQLPRAARLANVDAKALDPSGDGEQTNFFQAQQHVIRYYQEWVAAAVNGKGQSETPADTARRTNELNHLIDDLLNIYAHKTRTAEACLSALDKVLVPCLPLRFIEWILTQQDKFYTDTNGLWHKLFKVELNLSDEQFTELSVLRSQVAAQRSAENDLRMSAFTWVLSADKQSAASLPATQSLQHVHSQMTSLTRLHLQHAQHSLTALRNIMSPQQLARFLDWVERFGSVCITINV